MKITFLTPTLELHGGSLILAHYANHLVEQGHEVTIISPARGKGLPLHHDIVIKTYRPVPFRYIDTLLLQLPYWRHVRRLITEADFIIPIYTPLLWPAIQAKRRKKLKAQIVLIGQEAFEMIIIGQYNRFLLNRKIVQKNLAHIIAVSKPMAEIYKTIIDPHRVSLISNGIDLELFKPRDLPKEPYLLFVGRPVFPKGYGLFKDAFKQLREIFPNLEAKVIAPDLEAKNDEGIEFVPFKNREQLAKLYNQAAVYVCASTGESFGLPALEAMASKTAVVTTATVGSTQYAINEENCLVVPIGDLPAMTTAIRRLLKDGSLAKKIIIGGLETSKKYDQKKSLANFSELLEKLSIKKAPTS
jgi:glycosyltransferase involved in cell wall biosynthesis